MGMIIGIGSMVALAILIVFLSTKKGRSWIKSLDK